MVKEKGKGIQINVYFHFIFTQLCVLLWDHLIFTDELNTVFDAFSYIIEVFLFHKFGT